MEPQPRRPWGSCSGSASACRKFGTPHMVRMRYSSRTPDFPKGGMFTHRNILNNSIAIGERQCFTEFKLFDTPSLRTGIMGRVLKVIAVTERGGETGAECPTAVQREPCNALMEKGDIGT